MDHDDDDYEEINPPEELFQQPLPTSNFIERNTFFERFIPQQTIIYIQYCLLRIPLLLIYDYFLTEQFTSLVQSFLQYSIAIIDQQNEFLFKPVSYILHSYFFQLLIYLNLTLSLPVLGKIKFMK
jgi:hypothetical protein